MPPQTAIVADDETTWPEALRAHLARSLIILAKHADGRRRIDELCEKNSMLKYSGTPQNPHAADREHVVAAVDALIADAVLVGYHCTRLHLDEVPVIERDGLRPLSQNLSVQRVRARVDAGDFAHDVGQRLIAASLAAQRNRAHRTWFVFTSALLQREAGVVRFFLFWGGEAIYAAHETDPNIGGPLREVGTACIVEAAVPVRSIDTFVGIGERLVRGYVHRRGHGIEHDPEWEGHVERPIQVVRRVISRSHPDFARLTNCDRWNDALS